MNFVGCHRVVSEHISSHSSHVWTTWLSVFVHALDLSCAFGLSSQALALSICIHVKSVMRCTPTKSINIERNSTQTGWKSAHTRNDCEMVGFDSRVLLQSPRACIHVAVSLTFEVDFKMHPQFASCCEPLHMTHKSHAEFVVAYLQNWTTSVS